jgi:hypothetical protein
LAASKPMPAPKATAKNGSTGKVSTKFSSLVLKEVIVKGNVKKQLRKRGQEESTPWP